MRFYWAFQQLSQALVLCLFSILAGVASSAVVLAPPETPKLLFHADMLSRLGRLSNNDLLLLQNETNKILQQQQQTLNLNVFTCNTDLTDTDVLQGAFTRVQAKQTAYYYVLCQSFNPDVSIYGLSLAENNKIFKTLLIKRQTGSNMLASQDINSNGISEVMLSDGINSSDTLSTTLDILELDRFIPKIVQSFGVVSFNNCLSDTGNLKQNLSLYVTKGAIPQFFKVIYNGSCTSGQFKKVSGLLPLGSKDTKKRALKDIFWNLNL